jgi:hypothetical protein
MPHIFAVLKAMRWALPIYLLPVLPWLDQDIKRRLQPPGGQHNPAGLNLTYMLNEVGLLTAPMLFDGQV